MKCTRKYHKPSINNIKRINANVTEMKAVIRQSVEGGSISATRRLGGKVNSCQKYCWCNYCPASLGFNCGCHVDIIIAVQALDAIVVATVKGLETW